MRKIAVLFGGCSSEYEVSLQSAYAVLKNWNRERYEVIMAGISREGSWFLYEGDLEAIREDCWQREIKCFRAELLLEPKQHGLLVEKDEKTLVIQVDAVFPLLHGKNGEDGTVQGALELAGIPIIGCGTLASAVCMDKELAHRIVGAAGIKVPRCRFLARETKREAESAAEELGYPVFIKPLRAGSSFGITKVSGRKELPAAIELAFSYDDFIVMEETILGFEVGCAILGTKELTIGAVDEIELSEGFFDYEEKYHLKTSKIHVPARITPEKAEEIQRTATIIYQTLRCAGFARVDMFLTSEGEIYFNEVNTIPGFTDHSRFPGMLMAAGLSFTEIIDRLIEDRGLV